MLRFFIFFNFIFLSPYIFSCNQLNLNDQLINLTNISNRYNSSLAVSRYSMWTECRYFIGFTQGSSGGYNRKMYNGSYYIEYDLSGKTNFQRELKDYPDITNNKETIQSRFRKNKGSLSNTHSFYLKPKNLTGNEPAGTYQDVVSVKLYNGRYNSFNYLVTSKNLTVQYTIPYHISMSLVEPGAPHDEFSVGKSLDFGNLETGKMDYFDIVVVSNGNFQVRFSSQNDGKMKHVSVNSYVDYTLNVAGNILNLSGSSSSPVIGATGSGPTASSGSRYSSSIQIGTINNQVAGSYQDVITVSVINI